MKKNARSGFLKRLRVAVFTAGALGLLPAEAAYVVNSLADVPVPGAGEVTLRSALELAADGESIVFDPALDGGTIELSIVGEEHSILIGELMGGSNAPSGYISYLIGYYERDYGRSALYAQKDVVIDASALAEGITLKWGGGDLDPARVLAVYGDLTIKNVSVTGGRSVSVELPEPDPGEEYGQLSTRARGGGLAVWGVADLENCRLYDNACSQVWSMPVRDGREGGVFGGGIYADIVEISDCVISGNTLTGAGVSGGGIFSVGGRDTTEWQSIVKRSAVTGNSIAGIFTYGGGVYSDGGGIGKLNTISLQNCTIADNLVDIYGPSFLYGSGYWRGGGFYMSNGRLSMHNCTVVENQVHGVARTNELEKSNLAGGLAATIGNAHAAESMTIGHSIITGNTVHEFGGGVYSQDIFTGSLFEFISEGHNRIGTISFSQILVPVSKWDWYSLCRRHYPKEGDQDGISPVDVLDLSYGITRSPDILSAGVSAPNPAILHYIPKGTALDQVTPSTYTLHKIQAEYRTPAGDDNFLEIMLGRVESHYGLTNFAASFTADFETFLATVDLDDETAGNQPYTDPGGIPILSLTNTLWYGPAATWPSKLYNYPYIEFWHRLDSALQAENIPGMGPEVLGDDAWLALFPAGGFLAENPDIEFKIWTQSYTAQLVTLDQTGDSRPMNGLGDIGAMEYAPPATLRLELDNITSSVSNVLLYWSSAPDGSYSLWEAANLASNDWGLVESGITSTIPFNVYIVETLQDDGFFKLEVE